MRLTLLATGLPFLLAAACAAPESVSPTTEARAALVPAENLDMHERNVALAKRAKERADAKLVFLGDSITQGFEDSGRETWQREYAGQGALNLGVSGDRTEHVLWRLQSGAYDHLRPRAIVILLGTNNTGHRMDPPADIAAGMQEILAQLKRRFPESKLALLAIFPRGETPEDEMRKNNDAANALLAKIAREQGVEWLDTTRAFVDAQGSLSKDLMPDLLHPNARGYEVWANAIREPLKRWMQ